MSYEILLIKSDGCPHCENFKPVFEEFQKKLQQNKDLLGVGVSVITKIFNFNDNEYKQAPYKISNVSGVPTIYLFNTSKKSMIEIPNVDTVDKFIQVIKKNLSQTGGKFINYNDDAYLDKYLKYKNKYIALKRSL